MKSIPRFLCSFTAFGLVALSGGVASAEVPCWVRHIPGNTSLGTHGYTTVSLYSLPGCGGSYIQTMYLCSTGATSGSCASSPTYRYTEGQLMSHTQMLRAATMDGGDVFVTLTSCNGGGTPTCLGYFYYQP